MTPEQQMQLAIKRFQNELPLALTELSNALEKAIAAAKQLLPLCHAGHDGECKWKSCPQTRDKEPQRSGRHCPLDVDEEGLGYPNLTPLK